MVIVSRKISEQRGGALIELAMLLTTFCALAALVITVGLPAQLTSLSEEITIEESFIQSSLNHTFTLDGEIASSMLNFGYDGKLHLSPIEEIGINNQVDTEGDVAQLLNENDEFEEKIATLDRLINVLGRSSHSENVVATILYIRENGDVALAIPEPAFRTLNKQWIESERSCLEKMEEEALRVTGGNVASTLSNPYVLATCNLSSQGKAFAAVKRLIISHHVYEYPNIVEYQAKSTCFRASPYLRECN